MITEIKSILSQLDIKTYMITESQVEGLELYFIKKERDMKRLKVTTNHSVTVYRDFSKDDVAMRGSATVAIYDGMTADEIKQNLSEAYYAASFVVNRYYPLPTGQQAVIETNEAVENKIEVTGLEEAARLLTEALFSEDIHEKGWINCAELFISQINSRLINSEGIDVSYVKYQVRGEFVTQWTEEQDVENYFDFSYDDLMVESLRKKVREALLITKERARAKLPPKSGKYPVILSDNEVVTLLEYYGAKASANMIYPGYSHFKIGDQVQAGEIVGDALTICLKPNGPFSSEGIAMTKRPLLKDGVLQTIHGDSRFSHYLGIEAIGLYHGIEVEVGTMELAEMKQGEYLHVVAFSDFQVDTFTGHFGSEIRLGFYSDGETVVPVTGGSLSGSLVELAKNMKLSKELHEQEGYKGPKAVKLVGASISGE